MITIDHIIEEIKARTPFTEYRPTDDHYAAVYDNYFNITGYISLRSNIIEIRLKTVNHVTNIDTTIDLQNPNSIQQIIDTINANQHTRNNLKKAAY